MDPTSRRSASLERPVAPETNPFITRPTTPASAQALNTDDVDHPALPPGAGAAYHDEPLSPPSVPFVPYADSPTPSGSQRNSVFYPSTPVESNALLAPNEKALASPMDTPDAAPAPLLGDNGLAQPTKRRPLHRRPICWVLGAVALVIVAVAVIVPVVLTVGKHKSRAAGASGTPGGSGTSQASGAIMGGDGSEVTASDGSKFTYHNSFGGFWYQDPNDPFAYFAQPNSWTKPLNQTWDWSTDKIYGVNLGGWFVMEPFITPNYYQTYKGAVDEWTLSTMMAADTANGGLSQLETHYDTFITEKDIAEIAGTGLNWVRVPIPYWAIDTWNDEPFLAKTCWKYILRLFDWARKYGLRVNLDLHTVPGSQNGFNHSGRLGPINWLLGLMGIANAQRHMQYVRTLAEFVSQPEYENLIPMFGMVNEPLLGDIGIDALTRFYLQGHDMIRGITGIGKGPVLTVHDGFQGNGPWVNFLQGSDRIAMDQHQYLAFGGAGAMSAPFLTGTGASAGGTYPATACNAWGGSAVASQQDFGITIAGEFSAGWNDCGLYLHGVNADGSDVTPTYPGDCSQWTNWQQYTQEQKDGLNNFVKASMDALQNWFFWTWKIGNSTAGDVECPMWSYQLGLENGWIPSDPRTATGTCASYNVQVPAFNGSFQSWQTGGASAGTIAASSVATFGQWPPPTLSGVTAVPMSAVATYTATAPASTLTVPAYTNAKGKAVKETASGWADKSDTASGVTTVAGCEYPDAWTAGAGGTVTTPVCTGDAQATFGAGAVASVATAATTAVPA